MIRVTGRFSLITTDAAAVDAAFDRIMDTLVVDSTVLEPTLSVDLGEAYMLVELLVDTSDGIEASQTAMSAIATAFLAAGIERQGEPRVILHDSLFKGDRFELTTERVPIAV